MTLEQFILDYIRQHRSVTFGELSDASGQAGYAMHGDMELRDDRALLWCCMSTEFAETVFNLLDRQEVQIVPTTKLDYLVCSPRIMVTKENWEPCRLEAI